MLVPGTERVEADPSSSQRESSEHQQRSRMVMALAVLLLALGVVLLKDRELMPSAASAPEANFVEEQPSKPNAPIVTEAATEALPHTSQPVQPIATEKKRKTASPASVPDPSETQPIVATERAVLPPLDVQVVAGNQQRPLTPTRNAVKVDMSPPSPEETATATQPPPRAAHVEMSRDVSTRVSRSVQPEYPVLAKQMKVQGAVVLQALIGREGSIQDLHVVTGPAILAAAAQEAVRQWHFKPYLQNGQAVETEARITVNFTISTY